MTDTGQVLEELRMECHAMAIDMVRLERWAAEAYGRKQWIRVGELHTQRQEVQGHRSMLLRQLWAISGRRRIQAALHAGY